jgi:hypothetical protein
VAALQRWEASASLAVQGSRCTWRVKALEINLTRDSARSARYCLCVSRVETWETCEWIREEGRGWSTGAGLQSNWRRNSTKTATSLASSTGTKKAGSL